MLVAPIEAILRRHEPRQLLVVHTLGSHFPFSARYPAAYERFTPSPRDGQGESINDRVKPNSSTTRTTTRSSIRTP